MLARRAEGTATRLAIQAKAAAVARIEIGQVARELQRVQKDRATEMGRRKQRHVDPAPVRTEEEMRQAAIRLINQEIWDLEKKSEWGSLTEDERRALKELVLTLNQSLKAGKEKPRSPGEMSDEELEAATK